MLSTDSCSQDFAQARVWSDCYSIWGCHIPFWDRVQEPVKWRTKLIFYFKFTFNILILKIRCSLSLISLNFLIAWENWFLDSILISKCKCDWEFFNIKFGNIQHFCPNCFFWPQFERGLTNSVFSGASRNFRNGGGGGGGVPARYNFWGLEIVLMPLHTYHVLFLVRVENKIHIVNIACWLR